ncbi:MAG TPA: squalene--hopene cyclase [Candidatus Binataceae bacterium]|nr:squalene--hopene cyclase [Candidatus Binataceae bacterium]
MDQISQTPGGPPASHAVARDEFSAKVDFTIGRAQQSLIRQQHPEGYWQAALEANAEMNAEYIIFNRFMELDRDAPTETKLKKLLFDLQLSDGSWTLFPGGPGHLSTSIEAYFALKLTGMRAGDDPMMRARRWILAQGGIANSGTLARFYLAAMNQVTWDATPSLPVEITLLPNWFPVNMYELSSWARGTLFALMLLQAQKPVVPVDWRDGALELFIQPPHFTKFTMRRGDRLLSLRNALRVADKGLRAYDKHHLKALRGKAIRHAESWLLDHQDANGSWGGIQPCYLLSPMALKGLGYRNDHPVIIKALEAVRELIWDQGDSILYQPCISPNWDTALAAKALLDSGIAPDHPAVRDSAKWLIDHQIFKKGDWSIKRPDLEPGGWAFEFYNDWFPDVDDSAVILMVLAAAQDGDPVARERAIRLGANWVMGMQSSDGGFAAFDVDNDSKWLNDAPFADVQAATDPTCADLTGRVLEMMAAVGYRADHPVARRAVTWLKRDQKPDGSWWGRWGVSYVYGTFSALSGLRAIGADLTEPWIKRAATWLKSVQNTDGGWGESCLADGDPLVKGKGTSTPSQTAWGLIGLLAAEDEISDSVMRGVGWLLDRQNEAGRWVDDEFTGTGFPNHFYLRYHMYAHYFPLMALGRFRRRRAERTADRGRTSLRDAAKT